MKSEVVYTSGQTYYEHLSKYSVRVSRGQDRVAVRFNDANSDSKKSGMFSLRPEDAQRLAHAILLACSGDVRPIEFSADERTEKRAA